VLAELPHPFASRKTLRLGQPLALEGPCIVFSNELFDAQPCRRFLRQADSWVELGVQIDASGKLTECQWGRFEAPWLPQDAPEGYHFDAPLAAASLAGSLAAQDWSGLFLAFDYGKCLDALSSECPSGTLRAYRQHSQKNDLLADPGLQDLTCHVCWDWLAEALSLHGFDTPKIESQEAFLVRHAGAALSRITAAEASRPSQRKMALLELLHPANMGRSFQVLQAWRNKA